MKVYWFWNFDFPLVTIGNRYFWIFAVLFCFVLHTSMWLQKTWESLEKTAQVDTLWLPAEHQHKRWLIIATMILFVLIL